MKNLLSLFFLIFVLLPLQADAFNNTATGYGIAVYADTTSEFESFLVVNP